MLCIRKEGVTERDTELRCAERMSTKTIRISHTPENSGGIFFGFTVNFVFFQKLVKCVIEITGDGERRITRNELTIATKAAIVPRHLNNRIDACRERARNE